MIFSGDLDWSPKCSGDFDGDGKADIAIQSVSSGAVIVWLMNGAAVREAGVAYYGGDPAWVIKDSGDYDGDGKGDIALRHSPDGTPLMWFHERLYGARGVRRGRRRRKLDDCPLKNAKSKNQRPEAKTRPRPFY